ncbi:MAG: hypothetical protein F6J89_11255 [Symploca sp. SIO1C4]|uniref:Uncharacterized protein n=1 Tax=Symploca sp. SIO1C4 TaxID=2607765 RepID=A0A6B3N9L1_9CYAN|nr:hypothetical protein [Symploca sp. SIO1C4]
MSSSNNRSSEKVRRKKHEIIKNAVKELGFENEAEFARKSGIDQGNLNRILTGQIKLTDQRANQLCWAIFEKNCNQGFNYSDCACYLAASINYSWNHIACLEDKKPRVNLTELDVNKWVKEYRIKKLKMREIEQRASNFNEEDHVRSADFSAIMEYIEVWKLKHDFDLPNIIQQRFKMNLDVFSDFIDQGIKQINYEEVKQVFKNIRHIAHLSGDNEFVIKVSCWLREYSRQSSDINTYLMAESTLAWSHTSYKDRQAVNQAKYLTERAWNLLSDLNVCMTIDADVIAILSELKLRIPIRLHMLHAQHFSDEEFELIQHQSQKMVDRLIQDRTLEPRLRERFKIALQYQHGIYYFWTQKYEKAIQKFTDITEQTNLIGWKRVEQGAYSWLGTLSEQTGNIDACLKYLSKIDNENANQKRLDLRDLMYARLGMN